MRRRPLCIDRAAGSIIDDWGPEPLNAEQRRDLLEIVDDREGKGSLLITSQVPIGRWHEIIGDPTLGDAILDRVIHRSHRIELKGESLRKRQALVAADSLTVVPIQRHVMLSAVPSSAR
jgi:IstB-like ATP binding protein